MSEKKIVIAPVGDNIDSLFVGIREFPTERVILLSPQDRLESAEQTKKDLERFKIPAQIIELTSTSPVEIWEEIFEKISGIKNVENEKDLMINVATGDGATRCAATSAAFVNGLKAFAAGDYGVHMLPVLKFSYYKLLTDRKIALLKILAEPKCCGSLEELSKRTGMSLPLVSYHVNGNLKSEGLKDLGLIETKDVKGRTKLKLSTLGRMIVKGYVASKE